MSGICFATKTFCRQLHGLQQLEGHRMDGSVGEASGAIGAEFSLAPMVQQHFGDDGPRGISRAQK